MRLLSITEIILLVFHSLFSLTAHLLTWQPDYTRIVVQGLSPLSRQT